MSGGDRPTAYWDYIELEKLLALQTGIGPDEADLSQDEVVFITVHQVYELWFKLAIRDVVTARDLFAKPLVPDDALAGANRLLTRVRIIFDLSSQHFPLVETISTRDFLSFRDKLFPANGGQSPQFRELEALLGIAEEDRIPYVTGGSYQEVLKNQDGTDSWASTRVAARVADRPNLKEAVDSWLYRTPIDGSSPDSDDDPQVVDNFISHYLTTHEGSLRELAERVAPMAGSDEQRTAIHARYEQEITQARHFLNAEDETDPAARSRRRRIRASAIFIEIYRELPLLAWPREVLEGLVALEQSFIAYRQRHARMAERVIGRRVGTGGSSGVEYLDRMALEYRVFKDLWGVRTLLVKRDRLRDTLAPEFYGFRADS